MSADGEALARVRDYLRESIEVTRQALEAGASAIVAAADLMVATFDARGKVLLCGNGGSAADCQHMAAELVSGLRREVRRPGLPAVALTTDTSFLTAFANDHGYADVFARQVRTLGRAGDTLIAISTSGSSANVVRAIEAARATGLHVIALTGARGPIAGMADVAVAVPSEDTQHIQESHLAIEHLVCELVERRLFPTSSSPRPVGVAGHGR